MSDPKFKATMTIPKGGKAKWTGIMQEDPPKPVPEGVGTGEFLVASSAEFPDGVRVFGGVGYGGDVAYALFMVFDADYNRVGGWPIDTSDWEDFDVSSVQFAVDPNDEDGNYLLNVQEAS